MNLCEFDRMLLVGGMQTSLFSFFGILCMYSVHCVWGVGLVRSIPSSPCTGSLYLDPCCACVLGSAISLYSLGMCLESVGSVSTCCHESERLSSRFWLSLIHVRLLWPLGLMICVCCSSFFVSACRFVELLS